MNGILVARPPKARPPISEPLWALALALSVCREASKDEYDLARIAELVPLLPSFPTYVAAPDSTSTWLGNTTLAKPFTCKF